MGSRAAREASSIQWKYHIFLSFRGIDTRNGFTSHLHEALKSRGYDVFMDEADIEVGQGIKPKLLQAIEKSKISVIVFSKRYADSRWCLNELVKIMECRRTLNQIVLPIFYNVDPSDVRHQTGTLASDFQKHTIQHEDEVVKKWRKALTEAANLCGEDLKDRNEAKFIQAFIENNIVGRLSTPLPVAAYPVGVDSRVHDMISYLLGGGSQDVVMIGIWGMGGLGKTTAAKAIYNRIKDKFDAHGFLGDIRDTANRHGLVYLQKLLLAEINKKPTKFHISCVDGGMGMIKKELGRKRVLVIIDDVDDEEQLEAIVGNRDWFGSGSRIIITTRDKRFLDVLHVNKIFTVPEMNPDEGLELFCRHAFQKGCPNKRYLELSKKVVFYSGGLPLALKVLGSFLIGRSIEDWKRELKELERIRPKDILKKLRISYDGLDNIEKCIFLDIYCFFIGMNKDHVIKILDGCDFEFEAAKKIRTLLEKCLLTVNEKNQLMMHDLLRDMGRAICQERDPEGRRRLWLSPEDLTGVLEDKSETKKVERLALNLRSSEKVTFLTEAFSEMRKLKLLQLNYAELTGEYKLFLSKNLRWLCWHGFLLDSIPGDFDLRSLVAMDLQFSKLKIVWKDCKVLEKLTIINLSHSHDLTTSPDFSKLPNLEELIMECTSLSDVHESIGDLKRLALVNLEHCKMLKDLPLNLYRSKSIETLLLNGCSKFENLAEDLGDMVSLRTLEADDTAVTKIPSSIVKLKNLESLALCGLERLTGFLPHSYLRSTGFLPPLLDGLNSLRKLALAHSSLTDDELPKDLGSLSSLEHLDCGQNSFCRLPSLSGLSKLEYLCLNDCRKLRAIPELPTNVKVLRGFGCTELETMPDFSEMSSIRELYLSDSYKLTEIPGLDKSLNSLTRIHMEGCTNLTPIFIEKILQGWTSCGFGGIYLGGIYGIPSWFKLVGNEYNVVDFEVPQGDLKGLTLCCVYSSDNPKPTDGLGIMVMNVTQGTTLHTWPAIASVKTDSKPEDDYLWQGQLSNERLSLQGGDKVLLSVFATVDFVRVKKVGVNLEWYKVMKENMHDSDPHLYDLDPIPDWFSRTPDEAGPSQGEPLRELQMRQDQDFSILFKGWTSCGYGGIFLSFLSGNDILDWFHSVHEDNIVYFTVPQSVGRILKGLILSFVCSSGLYDCRIRIKNMTQRTELDARITPLSTYQTGGYYLWQGLLSNDELKLQDGDKVLIEIIIDDWENVKKTGVSLVWDKFMNENMIDYHLCAYEQRPYLVNNVDIINVKCDFADLIYDFHDLEYCFPDLEYHFPDLEYHFPDFHIRKSRKFPNLSKFPNLKKLTLKGCTWLYKVHSSIGDLGGLSSVNLEGCCMLKDLPLNFYKSKSIETLILNGCRSFEKLAEGLGDMVSLTTLEADETGIRQIPSSIVKLKKLNILSLSGCWLLPEDAIPSLAGLSKLEVLCLNACRNLLAIPDLPTNLYVLKANDCPELETIPDFSKMSNMRELHLRDSVKLTEVPGLDKSLNSMTRIHMEGCTNLTADFRNSILQGWTSCGYGGICLSGNDIPGWFGCVHDDDIVYFTVPQSDGRNLKGLTLSFDYSSAWYGTEFRISIKNMEKDTELEARIIPDCPTKGYYLWQGQLSNDELKLQDGDKVLIEIIIIMGKWGKVKKTGVSLVWDKFMNENMFDYHLCEYERRPSQNLVNDDDIIHVKGDYHTTKSPDFSKFPNLEKLILEGCERLYKVHSYIGDLERLSWVNLEGCIILKDLPLNFYKSKSIKTLILNGCSKFENLADGLGDMVSLTTLKADNTAIRQIPSSIVKLKKLRILSLSGCKDLLAIPDLPTNLYVLKANGCPELETIPDFSKMSNMRELHLRDSVKLTEVPGLDKSLNSMTRIHMEGCTNLTADFRNNILQRWTSR